MIFNVIEATAGTTGLCIIRLTEVKRIVSHKFILSLHPKGTSSG
jgi:hypothetical protein